MELKEIAEKMKLDYRMQGKPVKRKLSRNLWLTWTGKTLSLTRLDVYPSDKEVSIYKEAFALGATEEDRLVRHRWCVRRLTPLTQTAMFTWPKRSTGYEL